MTEKCKEGIILTELAACWNDRAAIYDASHGGENHAAWIRELARLVPDKSCTILDAGAGTGFLTIKLAALGCRVTASDISDGMLAIAEQKAVALSI